MILRSNQKLSDYGIEYSNIYPSESPLVTSTAASVVKNDSVINNESFHDTIIPVELENASGYFSGTPQGSVLGIQGLPICMKRAIMYIDEQRGR